MTGKQIFIGLGLLAVGITVVILVTRKKDDEPKGEGEVSAETKKENKIVFTKK
jgi:hypothetical protein